MKNICEILNIKYPIIQGAMANITDGKFASIVSNAGGLGVIASGANDEEWVRNEIRVCKSLTTKPFAVNMMLMNPRSRQIADVIIEEKVPVVTTGAGNPRPFIQDFKNAGIIVAPVVPNVKLAKRVCELGADFVIAEGMESGGHIGSTTTISLIPQVVDAITIPVVAAGGIADKRGVLAAFALGAKGIQVGTLLLTSSECPIHDNYKNLILSANDTDTLVTGVGVRLPVRVLKNKMSLEYVDSDKEGANLYELEMKTMGSLKKAIEGNIDEGSFMAGQISGLIHEVLPVSDIIHRLFDNINLYKESITII